MPSSNRSLSWTALALLVVLLASLLVRLAGDAGPPPAPRVAARAAAARPESSLVSLAPPWRVESEPSPSAAPLVPDVEPASALRGDGGFRWRLVQPGGDALTATALQRAGYAVSDLLVQWGAPDVAEGEVEPIHLIQDLDDPLAGDVRLPSGAPAAWLAASLGEHTWRRDGISAGDSVELVIGFPLIETGTVRFRAQAEDGGAALLQRLVYQRPGELEPLLLLPEEERQADGQAVPVFELTAPPGRYRYRATQQRDRNAPPATVTGEVEVAACARTEEVIVFPAARTVRVVLDPPLEEGRSALALHVGPAGSPAPVVNPWDLTWPNGGDEFLIADPGSGDLELLLVVLDSTTPPRISLLRSTVPRAPDEEVLVVPTASGGTRRTYRVSWLEASGALAHVAEGGESLISLPAGDGFVLDLPGTEHAFVGFAERRSARSSGPDFHSARPGSVGEPDADGVIPLSFDFR